ncbi:MAG: glycoside hydrolase 5 family protein [Cyclonatronaceae bacterium]
MNKKINFSVLIAITVLFFTFYNTGSDRVDPDPVSDSNTTVHTGFVHIQNGMFALDGNEFRFAGTNAYYLPNYNKIDPDVVERTFNTFKAAGITVVRMWAFYDGYDCGYSSVDSGENVIQTSPGIYNEEALRDLDFVIARGKQQGIKFILPLINFWDDLGGICQYNTWAGASNPSTNMAFFLSNSSTQNWFKDYINMLLNRVNTITGVAYKNEPAILSWQIMNEGRNRGQNPEILRDWYREIAQYIKTIDPNHLVGTGEEGFDEGTPSIYSIEEYSNTYALRANEGTSYLLNTAIPEIDYGNAHWYPTEYGFGYTITPNLLTAQKAWLMDHSRIAKNHGKPFILGEYGFPGWGDDRVSTMYAALWAKAEKTELDGSLLWQLTSDYTKCTEFGGNICWPGGRVDSELFLAFMNHINQLQTTAHQ